jgi:SAM-dependent methyltransferase
MDRPPVPRAYDVAWEGTPSWETGEPQPVVLRLLSEGAIRGRVLDAGCGSGLHAVLLAGHGHDVVGLDVAPRAVELARARAVTAARARAGQARPRGRRRFLVGDVLDPEAGWAAELGDAPDTILDIGLFHCLQPADSERYAEVLASITAPGARAFVLCWSDGNPLGIGPERVSRRDLRHAFRAVTGWRIIAIEDAELATRLPMGRVHAWLARIERR